MAESSLPNIYSLECEIKLFVKKELFERSTAITTDAIWRVLKKALTDLHTFVNF